MPRSTKFIEVPATEIRQRGKKKIYSFVIDGKEIPSFASISRLKRGSDSRLAGYQRPEVRAHIDEIRTYLESPSAILPNGIVLALDSSVKFFPSKGHQGGKDFAKSGILKIPVPEGATDSKPGFIVDGQQRVAAIRDAQIRQFPVVVTAFITKDIAEQTEQFILVNSTKPLNKSLIYEILPYTEARLPSALHRRRTAARILEHLNHREESPFRGMIQMPTNPGGTIKDNSILRMLEQSLSDGVLFHVHRSGIDVEIIDKTILEVLFAFWWAVRDTFPDAWALPPRKSRLVHGAGIISVGNLMDHIGLPGGRVAHKPLRTYYRDHLALVARDCAWTEGAWQIGETTRRWNDIQNTRQDVATLADHLQRRYDTASASA